MKVAYHEEELMKLYAKTTYLSRKLCVIIGVVMNISKNHYEIYS